MNVSTTLNGCDAGWRETVKSIASNMPSSPRPPSASSRCRLAVAARGSNMVASRLAYGAITRSPGGVRRKASLGAPNGPYWNASEWSCAK